MSIETTQPAALAYCETRQTRDCHARLRLAGQQYKNFGEPSLVTVAGDPGLGKTELVDRFVNKRYTDKGLLAITLPLSSAPKPNEIAARLLRHLGHPSKGPGYTQRDDVIDVLAERRGVIVIDEAHHLTQGPMRDIKMMFDHLPRTDFILIGTSDLPDLIRKLAPELTSRVDTAINLQPLPVGEVIAVMPLVHPLLEHAEPELLVTVDESFAHGRWREWRQFTMKAAQLAEIRPDHPTTLDSALMALALDALGTRPDKPTGQRKKRNQAKAT